jgi:hypothetical protein
MRQCSRNAAYSSSGGGSRHEVRDRQALDNLLDTRPTREDDGPRSRSAMATVAAHDPPPIGLLTDDPAAMDDQVRRHRALPSPTAKPLTTNVSEPSRRALGSISRVTVPASAPLGKPKASDEIKVELRRHAAIRLPATEARTAARLARTTTSSSGIAHHRRLALGISARARPRSRRFGRCVLAGEVQPHGTLGVHEDEPGKLPTPADGVRR